MFYKSERTTTLDKKYITKVSLPDFSDYVNGSAVDKEAFLKDFKKRDLFTTLQGLFRSITAEELTTFCTNKGNPNLYGEKLLQWIASSACTSFTSEQRQAMIGFTAIIATESFSKFIPGTQGANLATCSAVPPIISCFRHLKPVVVDGIEYVFDYNSWQKTNVDILPYLMGKGLGCAIQNKGVIADAIEELAAIGANMSDNDILALLAPPANRVFYPKNFPSKSLPKDLKTEAYNSLGYFERCMMLNFWIYKTHHPDMIRDPFNWDKQQPMLFPLSSKTTSPNLDTKWMNLFNNVRLNPEVEVD